MRRLRVSLSLGIMLLLLVACGQGPNSNTSAANNSSQVSLSITDEPPNGVTVLFFQVSLTAASLTPASGSSVSLLTNNTPIQIDVTQLQAISAFLSTANVPAGTLSLIHI